VVLIAIDGKAREPLIIADRINVTAPVAVQADSRQSFASRSWPVTTSKRPWPWRCYPSASWPTHLGRV